MLLDDPYITKDMFKADNYKGNYYANKNAVMFDLQNGKQNVISVSYTHLTLPTKRIV